MLHIFFNKNGPLRLNITRKGLTVEYSSTPKEILKSVATQTRRMQAVFIDSTETGAVMQRVIKGHNKSH